MLRGDAATLSAVLGRPGIDPQVPAMIMPLLGGMTNLSERTAHDGAHLVYLVFGQGGAEVMVRNDVVEAVVVHLVPADGIAPYQRPTSLLAGLSTPVTVDGVRAALGSDVQDLGDGMLATDGVVVVTEADGDAVQRLTLTLLPEA